MWKVVFFINDHFKANKAWYLTNLLIIINYILSIDNKFMAFMEMSVNLFFSPWKI